MVKSSHKVCAFCGQTGGGELGGLQNTSDKTILAHYNCMIFSPLVFTTDSEDDPEFVIKSVLAEIKRGKSLKCSYCKQYGATIGCEVKRCQKTYHYECVEKDNGTRDDDHYIIYCCKHVPDARTDSDSPEDTEKSITPDRPSTSKENKLQRCSYCKRNGATIGCIIETCRKKYHISCVEKDEGTLDLIGDDQHVAYCFKHARKDSDASEESERSETPDGPSTSYAIRETRNSTPGKYSSPRTKKDAEKDPEWFGSSGRSSTPGKRSLGKRTRTSTPKRKSSPQAKKKKAELDTESSGSSERPSTSYGSRPSRTTNRVSGVYSSQRSNKKRSPIQDAELSISSSSSGAAETPVRAEKRKSTPRQIFKQNSKPKRTLNKVKDHQTATNDASNEASPKTVSALPEKPKARRGRPPSNRKKQQAASTQKKRKTFASEDIQQSDSDAQAQGEEREEMDEQAEEEEREEINEQSRGEEREEKDEQSVEEIEEMDAQTSGEVLEEVDAQTSGEEILEVDAQTSGEEILEVDAQTSGEEIEEVDVQASGVARRKVAARAKNAERAKINAEVESNQERTTPLSPHTLNDTCIPSTSQARFAINELYFTQLNESQCRIANSIESGIKEFRNFAEQFQTLFKQFMDVCQSLNHGIGSNLINAHEQSTVAEVHQTFDATPDPLPLSHNNSHIPSPTHDIANDADLNIITFSPENTPTNEADTNLEILSPENTPTNEADTNLETLSPENTPTEADTNLETLSPENTPTNEADTTIEILSPENAPTNDGNTNIETISPKKTPTNKAKASPRITRSSMSGKKKLR